MEEHVEEATGQVRFVPSKESKKGKKRKREADTKDPPLLVIEDGQPLDKKVLKNLCLEFEICNVTNLIILGQEMEEQDSSINSMCSWSYIQVQ